MSRRNQEIARRWLAGEGTFLTLGKEYHMATAQKAVLSVLRDAIRNGETTASKPSFWKRQQHWSLQQQCGRKTLPWE